MWFIENSWSPIILMCVVSLGLLISYFNTKRGLYLSGCLLLWAGCVAVYFVEQAIVTESEHVEQSVLDIADAFQTGDKQKTLSFFSPFADKERAFIKSSFNNIEVQKGLRITALEVEMPDDKTAIADFRANGSVIIRGYGNSGHRPTRWKVRWVKDKTGWKITKVTRIHPLNGKELSFLHKGE